MYKRTFGGRPIHWGSLVSMLALVLFCCTLAYFGIGKVVSIAASRISDEAEVRYLGRIGASLLESAKTESLSVADRERFERAEQIFEKLISREGLRKLPFKLYLMGDSLPNAFAAPGGGVAVTSGLLSMVSSDAGLAMVLAHELGHHAHRDPLNGVGRTLIFGMISSMIFGADSFISGGLLTLAETSHTRSQEMAADKYGLDLVFQTYGTTKGALEFFYDIQKDPRLRDVKALTFLSSHPYTPDRLKALKKRQSQLESVKK